MNTIDKLCESYVFRTTGESNVGKLEMSEANVENLNNKHLGSDNGCRSPSGFRTKFTEPV